MKVAHQRTQKTDSTARKIQRRFHVGCRSGTLKVPMSSKNVQSDYVNMSELTGMDRRQQLAYQHNHVEALGRRLKLIRDK